MTKYLLLFIFSLPLFLRAQPISSRIGGAATVTIDFKNGIMKDDAPVPYATKLQFVGDVDPKITTLTGFISKTSCQEVELIVPSGYVKIGTWRRLPNGYNGSEPSAKIMGDIDAESFLRANSTYCLLIRQDPDDTNPDPSQQYISIRTSAKLEDYVKLDFGLGYAVSPRALVGSTTAHFYWFPTNSYVNFKEKFPAVRQVFMRTSLFFGIAPVTLSSQAKQDIKSFSSVGNLVFGIGVRSPFYWARKKDINGLNEKGEYKKDFLQGFRLNAGFMAFKQADPSILVKKDHRKFTPYFSFTYDASFTSIFAPIALLFGLK